MVLLIFGILAGALAYRLIAIGHETEQLEVDLVVRNIGVGLKLAIGERIMRGEEARIAELLEENPLNFLGETKVGAGETASLGAKRWRYVEATRELIYQTRQPAAFDGRVELRWHLAAHRDALGRTVGLGLESENDRLKAR